jgi:type II secretory pathway pseudopilin PulG
MARRQARLAQRRPGKPGGPPNREREAAFHLTDLLVLLAGVALLAAIVLPTADRVRAKARFAQCRANLGVVNHCVLTYASDHDETLPLVDPSPAPGGWWWYKEAVKRYAGLTGPSSPKDKVFACPNDRGYGDPSQPLPFSQNKRHDFTSYVFNGVNLPGIPNIAGRRTERIRDPARTLLVMEWTAHAPLSWHHSKTGRANSPFYNDAQNLVGFVDGHVDYIEIYYDGINPAFTRDPIGGYRYKYSGD